MQGLPVLPFLPFSLFPLFILFACCWRQHAKRMKGEKGEGEKRKLGGTECCRYNVFPLVFHFLNSFCFPLFFIHLLFFIILFWFPSPLCPPALPPLFFFLLADPLLHLLLVLAHCLLLRFSAFLMTIHECESLKDTPIYDTSARKHRHGIDPQKDLQL